MNDHGAKALGVALLSLSVGACGALQPQITRYPNLAPGSPTSRAVEVPGSKPLIFLSGQTPEATQSNAPEFSSEYWGDTRVQTLSVMKKIEAALKSVGLGMGDVVKMQVFLVGDPARDGRMDSAGFMEAYGQYFSTSSQPNRPARTTVQIAALGRPGMLVEIDVIAVRP